jgi:TRAP-type C4-dicarboxylate transport system permease small subunit
MRAAAISALDAAQGWLRTLSRWAAWAGGAGMLAASLLIFGEILFRNFDQTTYVGSGEISGYVFAVAITWGLSYCLHERAHVRIDILYQRLSPGLRAWLDLAAVAAMLIFAVVLATRAQIALEQSLRFNSASVTPLRVPLWIPQAAWVAGLIFFAVNCAFTLLHGLALMALGRCDRAATLYPVAAVADSAEARPAGTDR